MTSVEIITEQLGGSSLSQMIQQGAAPKDWFCGAPAGSDAWREWMQSRVAERDWKTTLERLAPAFEAGGEAKKRLDRVIQAGGVVVTTGQQPGLFGGPVYTWSKAVSALALAETLERETGIPACAVFWAATDDADFNEAASTVIARSGGAERISGERHAAEGTPMSHSPLGDVSSQLARLVTSSGSAVDTRVADMLRISYGAAETTVGYAYVRFLRGMLEPLGIPVLDASHAAVGDASEAILHRAVESAASIADALERRTNDIAASGNNPQVEHLKNLSLVFGWSQNVKRRLAIGETGEGCRLSPNVLLRPVVEREILPTVAYVAGPGELAYFAQVSAVARALNAGEPVAVPRWSCTLVEPHVRALLDKRGIDVGDLANPHEVEGRMAFASLEDGTARGLKALRAAISSSHERLGKEAASLGLDRALTGAMHSLNHRVDRLERRIVAGAKRREQAAMREIATLRGFLFPFGARQERALNLIPTLARHGMELLTEMRDAANPHAELLVRAPERSQ